MGDQLSQKASGLRGSGRVALGLVGVFAVTTIAVLPADAKHYRANVSTHERDHSSSSPPYAAIVVDGNSGSVLHSANADELRHPASLTKIMTLYLLFERLDAGKIKLDTQIPVSEHAAEQAPTKLGLKPGHTIAVEDAIKGLVTKSANDAAVVVAEALGGSEGDFAEMMTRKAHALGMIHTIYRNASGLPNDEQVTTAREQALLGRAVQERFPRYYRYFSTLSFTYHGETMSNHNHLLGRVEGVDGIKTGYTQASGFNLVTSVHRSNHFIVAVVLGGSSAGARDAKMRSLIEEHIAHASTQHSAPLIAEGAVAMPVTRTAEAKTDTKVKTTPPVADSAAAKPSAQTAEAKTDVKVKTYEVASAPQQHWPASKFSAAADEAESVPAPVRTKATSAAKATMAAADDTIKPIPVKTIKVKLAQTMTGGIAPTTTGDSSQTVDAAAPFKLLAGRAAASADTAPVAPAASVAAVAAAAPAAPIDPTPAVQAAPIAPPAATAKAAAPEETAAIAPAQTISPAAPAEPPVATPAKAPQKAPAAKIPAAKAGGMMLAAAAPPVLVAAPPVAEPAPTPPPAPVAAAPVSEASIIAALTSRPAPVAAKPQAAVAASASPTPVSAAPASRTVIAAAAPAPVASAPVAPAPVSATAISAAPATTTVIAAVVSAAPAAEPAPTKPTKATVVAGMTQTAPVETPAPELVAAAPATETASPFPAVQAYKPAPKPKAAPVASAPAPAPVVEASVPEAKAGHVMRAGWVIQVGAFDAEHDAQQRLSKAQAKTGHVLDRADPFTEPVLKGEKTLYRARFAGFQQKDEAEAVCKQLKRNDIDCMTIKN
jgi:D-alanyl-D-alanine carboxypeptidase